MMCKQLNFEFKLKLNLFIFFSLILLICCNAAKEERISEVQILEFTSLKPLDHSLEDIIDEVEFVSLKLPDSIFIGKIDKIVNFQEKYILHDNQHANALYFFDEDGQFISSLNRRGNGPGEYNTLDNFIIINDTLKIYDRSSLSLINYSFADLKFLSQSKTDNYYVGLVFAEQKDHFLGLSDDFIFDNEYVGLTINNGDFSIRKNFPKAPGIIEGSENRNFSLINGEYYFAEPFSEIIYKIENQDQVPLYQVDFGKYRIPKDVIDMVHAEDFYQKLEENDYAYAISNFNLNDDLISFNFYRGRDMEVFLGLYDLTSKKGGMVKTGNSFMELLSVPLSVSKNINFTMVYPQESKMIDDILKNNYQLIDFDAPLIVKYKFKLNRN